MCGHDVETALALHDQYDKLQDPAEKEVWLKNQTEIRENRVKQSDACRRFLKAEVKREKERMIVLQNKRREQSRRVAEKLKALGWAEEIDIYLGGAKFLYHRLLYVGEELNDTDWEEMRPELVAVLTKRRQGRIDSENDSKIRKRVGSWLMPAYNIFIALQPPSACPPPLLDVSFIPEVISALCFTPLDKPLPKELTDAAIARFPSYAKGWKRERDKELLDIIRQASPYANQDVPEDVLHLASTMFLCEGCHKFIRYPSVINHPCNFVSSFSVEVRAPGMKQPYDSKTKSSSTNHSVRIIQVEKDLARYIGDAIRLQRCDSVMWGGFHHIVFDEARYKHMINTLDALQWSRTTLLSDMEGKDPYLDRL
ncbi:hypothetical protein EST38_g10281 [Candolleomyces aberdarensis]|uniref:Uncharacterized protein n=1 Tax=Candolleomyces aberdarensis TaxID=2316362 RepID=A0A4Q2DB09_9AGAR|nr:hypothetical protein EST38_g10281 [Candolleomyces aberdarensis]